MHGVQPSEIEARVAALEESVQALREQARSTRQDAQAARHLAAAHDGDIADLGTKLDALRVALNGYSDQARDRLDRLDHNIGQLQRETSAGFAEMRAKLDQQAAGQQQIVDLLTRVIERDQ